VKIATTLLAALAAALGATSVPAAVALPIEGIPYGSAENEYLAAYPAPVSDGPSVVVIAGGGFMA